MYYICLDKTIAETKKIIAEEKEIDPSLEIKNFCGTKTLFNFEIPFGKDLSISHIGLAQLVFEMAKDMFYTSKIDSNGKIDETQKVFEPLQEGQHIADCLQSFSPDVLCWYSHQRSGNDMRFTDCIQGLTFNPSIVDYQKYYIENTQSCSEREETIFGALSMAANLYSQELLSNGYVNSQSEAQDVFVEEINNNMQAIKQFQMLTKQEFGEDSSQEDVEPNQE